MNYYIQETAKGPVSAYDIIKDLTYHFWFNRYATDEIFFMGNVIKYLFRMGYKTESTAGDLDKAIDYAKKLTTTRKGMLGNHHEDNVVAFLNNESGIISTGRMAIINLYNVSPNRWALFLENLRANLA